MKDDNNNNNNKGKEKIIPKQANEPVAPVQIGAPGCVGSSSTSYQWQTNLMNANANANFYGLNYYGLQRGQASLSAFMPPPVSYYPMLYNWHAAQELYLRSFASPSSYSIACSGNEERYLSQLPAPTNGDLASQHKDPTTFTSMTSFGVANPSSIEQNIADSSQTSTYLTGGCSNVNRSNTEQLGSGPSNFLPSSGFSNYFSRQSQMLVKEIVEPGASAGPVTMDQNKSNPASATEGESGPSTNRNEVVRGINLRGWLNSMGSNISKIEKLRLFRQIVEIVDSAHSQGIALLEIRPSSFTLLSTSGVKYVGAVKSMKSLTTMNQENANKRGLEHEMFTHDRFGAKKQKNDDVNARDHDRCNVNNISKDDAASMGKCWMSAGNAQLEKEWYSCPDGLHIKDLLPFNIYCLGLLLFEFLYRLESIEAHSAAMLDLHRLILPPSFLSENPEEAGFCFWLLHPVPSSRPTTREILQSELISGSENMCLSNHAASFADDVESDLLLHFLVSLKEHKEDKASKLLEILKYLEADIKEIERRNSSLKVSAMTDRDCDTRQEVPNNPLSGNTLLRDKLLRNITQLEDAYFAMRSHVQLTEMSDMDRTDKDLLCNRDRFSWVRTPKTLTTKEESVDRVGTFFNGICKFARYSKLEVCGTLRNPDILNSHNVISALSFDREEEYIAVAGVSRKIKIFEFSSLLDDSIDVQYPMLEMSNNSKFSCISWNNYIKNYLASADYDGLVQIWDASTGQVLIQHKEHQKRAWSVDFSQVDPIKFASGSDDCSLKMWSINERNSTSTIWNPANVCCVQFSAFSSHLLAFGSADYKISLYDLRHTKIPWCTLAGHKKAVSFVKFLDPEILVSSSTDSTLKLWDLKKTSLEGLSTNACSLTYRGHTNDKHFVGLAAFNGYIASGSETNEVYAYYRSLPMPITSHKFGYMDPISGNETSNGDEHFVSSLCWRRKSEMLVAANSKGNIKILRMV